ncbi:hypothetical protein QTP88_005552 [Uroleucon formosanum]
MVLPQLFLLPNMQISGQMSCQFACQAAFYVFHCMKRLISFQIELNSYLGETSSMLWPFAS